MAACLGDGLTVDANGLASARLGCGLRFTGAADGNGGRAQEVATGTWTRTADLNTCGSIIACDSFGVLRGIEEKGSAVSVAGLPGVTLTDAMLPIGLGGPFLGFHLIGSTAAAVISNAYCGAMNVKYQQNGLETSWRGSGPWSIDAGTAYSRNGAALTAWSGGADFAVAWTPAVDYWINGAAATRTLDDTLAGGATLSYAIQYFAARLSSLAAMADSQIVGAQASLHATSQ